MSEFTPNTEGVWTNLPSEIYHKAPGVSNSMLQHMEPPAKLQAYLQEPREATPAMRLGSLTHQLVLEPDKPLPQFAIKPDGMKFSTKEGMAWRDAHRHLEIITQADYDALHGMAASIAAHPLCRRIFTAGIAELSVFQRFTYQTSVLRKARMDFVPEGNSLVDIKTTMDASPEAFQRDLYERGYFSQAAYYVDIWNDEMSREFKQCFIFIAVEKVPPYLVACYRVDDAAIEAGRKRNTARLCRYMECSDRNEWPGYCESFVPIGLPKWAKEAA